MLAQNRTSFGRRINFVFKDLLCVYRLCRFLVAAYFCFLASLIYAGDTGGSELADFVELKLKGHTIRVETAQTGAAREKGLAGRAEIPPDTGMLFVFDTHERQSF